MKVGIAERDVALEKPDEDEPAAMGHKLEGSVHRIGIAGCVEHQSRQVALGELFYLRKGILAAMNHRRHSDVVLAELQTPLVDVHDRHVRPRLEGELRHGQPNWSRPDDERLLARSDGGPIHRVRSNAQCLHERELIQGQRFRRMQLINRNGNQLAHAAVGVNSQDLQVHAAVWFPAPAGDASLAIEVGF